MADRCQEVREADEAVEEQEESNYSIHRRLEVRLEGAQTGSQEHAGGGGGNNSHGAHTALRGLPGLNVGGTSC